MNNNINNKINSIKNLKKKIVLAPMAGITNSEFCLHHNNKNNSNNNNLFGILTIGAYSLDKETLTASEKIANKGRKEFIYNLNNFDKLIKNEINTIKQNTKSLVSVNIRFKNIYNCKDNIKSVLKYGDILELNCHCRQKEITELGIGEELLKKENNKILKENLEIINNLKNEINNEYNKNTNIFLKIRANVVSLKELINNLNNIKNYFDGLHIDCFYPNKPYADLEYLKEVGTNFKDKIIIGNNSVNSINSAEEMLKYCDLVSVARCVLNNNIKWIEEFNRKNNINNKINNSNNSNNNKTITK